MQLETIKWFGEWWGPPCDAGPRVETPVGGKCCYCAEAVAADDFGLYVLAAPGAPHVMPRAEDFAEAPMHAECWIRAVYGSVRHQRGECHGDGTCNDRVDGMTARQDASLAAAYFFERLDAYKLALAKGVN